MNRQRQRRRRRGSRGFTLVEILVAVVAFVILLTAVYAVFANGTRLRNRAQVRLEDSRLRARALALVRADLRGALYSGGRLAATLVGELQGPESRFPGYLQFTTSSGSATGTTPGTDIQEVEYYVADDLYTTNRDGGMLMRRVTRNLLAPVREEPEPEPLLAGVEAIELGFFDGEQWQDTWDASLNEGELPQAIRFRVLLVPQEDDQLAPPPLEVLALWTTKPAPTNSTASASTDSGGEGGGGGGGGAGGGGGGTQPPPPPGPPGPPSPQGP